MSLFRAFRDTATVVRWCSENKSFLFVGLYALHVDWERAGTCGFGEVWHVVFGNAELMSVLLWCAIEILGRSGCRLMCGCCATPPQFAVQIVFAQKIATAFGGLATPPGTYIAN